MASFEHQQHMSKGREAPSGPLRVRQTGSVHLSVQCWLSPPLVWHRPNLPSLQCGTEGCSHRHAPATFAPTPPTAKSSHRPYPNTMLCLLPPPPQYSPIPILSTATPPPRLLFTAKWSPSQSHSTVGLLFISLVFFLFPLSLSLAGSLSERLSCWSTVHREPQATTEKKIKPLANIATPRRDFIYVKYWDTSTIYRNLNLKCGKHKLPSSAHWREGDDGCVFLVFLGGSVGR